jgi:hypothetical protein
VVALCISDATRQAIGDDASWDLHIHLGSPSAFDVAWRLQIKEHQQNCVSANVKQG